MLQALRRRLERDEEGFTLIELMVVVLIIAILLAIAIPTFLGARSKAQDRAAQSNLRNTLTAEKTFYTDSQAYSALSSELTLIEPAIKYIPQVSAPTAVGLTTGQVGVATDTNVSTTATTVCLTVLSASGKVFQVADVASSLVVGQPGTYYFGPTVGSGNTPMGATCTAGAAALGASKF
jgi:type IV pilus assembly protein PilA